MVLGELGVRSFRKNEIMSNKSAPFRGINFLDKTMKFGINFRITKQKNNLRSEYKCTSQKNKLRLASTLGGSLNCHSHAYTPIKQAKQKIMVF